MARNFYVVFLSELGNAELAPIIPFWIRDAFLVGPYVYCRKFDAEGPYLNLQVDGANSSGTDVTFDLRIRRDYVKAIVKKSELGRIGIIGVV